MKRILVISPVPFVKTDNTGLTLQNMFQNWNKDCLAQFFIQPMSPDTEFCNNYYQVTDFDAAISIFRNKTSTRIIQKNPSKRKVPKQVSANVRASYKNPLTMIFRSFLWSFFPWKGTHFYNWIDDFNPDVIFFEIGDNPGLMKLAVDIKKRLNIPLIVHNTESYYFSERNYIVKSPQWTKLFYPILRKWIRYSYRKVMDHTNIVIYSCEKLQRDFSKEFLCKSEVLYNTYNVESNLSKRKRANIISDIKILYMGGLGLYRPLALLEVADVLATIDSQICLDIYGLCKDKNDIDLLRSHKNIRYHGFVSYDTVLSKIAQADILIHVESPFSVSHIRYGFSTKIPDSLASGSCFFVYSPTDIAGTEYIMSNIPEIVANDSIELKNKLNKIVRDRDYRYSLVNKCLNLAERNHSKNGVLTKFHQIVNEVTNVVDDEF